MSILHFKPAIWDAQILRTLEDNLVARKVCNLNYSGEIKQKGDTVYFSGLADPTVTGYSGSVTYEALVDASVEMKIDQANYFAFKVGDIDAAQAQIDLKNSQASRAAYKLRDTADAYILGKYADANLAVDSSGSSLEVDSATILSTIGLAQQKLAEQNVSESDMFMILPPWVQLKLKLAGVKFSINEGINGTGGMAWTKDLGFDVYITNNLTNAGSVAVPETYCLAGSKNAMAYAEQIVETEQLRLQDSFDDAVRGLHVFGHKVVKPNELCRLFLKYKAETLI